MSLRNRRAERKSARYWGPVVGRNARQNDSESGEPQLQDGRIMEAEMLDDVHNDAERALSTSLVDDNLALRVKEPTATDHDAITHSNRMESPLLRLPAEIRRHVWEFAFGYRTVHPRAMRGKVDWQPHRRRLNASKWGVSYDPCLQSMSDYELYDLSLQDPDADHWHADMHPELGAPGFHDCDDGVRPREHHYLVPPICKQLWEEASECAWETATFAFITSGDFQHFVHFSGARIDKVRQICLITPGMAFFGGHEISKKNKFERSWEMALNSGVLTEFTSLVGLHLVIRSFWGTSRWSIDTVENLEFPPDECAYLPEIIRVFRQMRLRPERTTVFVTNDTANEAYGYEDFTVVKRRKMARVIREFILEEKPSYDWTGPGQLRVKVA